MRVPRTLTIAAIALIALAHVSTAAASNESVEVQARLELLQDGVPHTEAKQVAGNVVLWLMPDASTKPPAFEDPPPGHFRMEQKNKNFNPHILVVPLGSTVEFPNLDPFFHNVFSQFNGKRFDLGLYEAGSTRTVRFDHEGVSFIFCNIHSSMAAVIVTLRTPYFAVATSSGVIDIHHVPPGDYELHVWAEGSDPKQTESLARHVHITAAQHDLGRVQVYVPGMLPSHKNKFGEDYKPDPAQVY